MKDLFKKCCCYISVVLVDFLFLTEDQKLSPDPILSPSIIVSGKGVDEVSGMKVTSNPARSATPPNTPNGTVSPYTFRSTIKGAIIGPILAQKELEPSPTFLTTVGKTSAEYM